MNNILKDTEIEVIQYLRPDGRKRRVKVEVGKDYVKKAKNMILSAEELTTGEIAIYGRLKGQSEEKETLRLAENGPGEKSPTNILMQIVDKLANQPNQDA